MTQNDEKPKIRPIIKIKPENHTYAPHEYQSIKENKCGDSPETNYDGWKIIDGPAALSEDPSQVHQIANNKTLRK